MYDPSTLYVDPILSNFATGYRDPAYYADVLFPFTTVGVKSGQYRVFDRSNRLIFKDRREPGTVANEIVGRKWSVDTFKTVQHSLQSPVLDEERRNINSMGGIANPVFGGALDVDPEADAVGLVVGALQRGHEFKVANIARNTANYAAGNFVTLSGTSQWNDYTGGTASASDPVGAILTGIRTIANKIGRPPNVMLMPSQGMSFIENHPRVIVRFQNFTLSAPDAFRQLTGFEGTIVGVGVGDDLYNTADNIDATESLTSFWGKDIILAYVDQTQGDRVLTFGKTFVYPQLGGETKPIDRWREPARKADLFRQTWEYDPKVVTSTAGYLIQNAFAASAW